jgi:phosphorylase pnp/udp family protein
MPIGAAAAALVTERMIRSGADSLVAVGSCGALRKLQEGEFVVPSRALRDEGTSYHYLKAGAWVETDEALRATVAKVARSAGFGAQVAPVWTTDGFFRETRALVEQRKSQGCVAVEMECAAMAAIAKVRGVRFAQLLFTADTLADNDYDLRGFGVDSHHVALSLALEAAAGC